MEFMRLFAGLTKLVTGQQQHPAQTSYTRKTLVLYTPVKELGTTNTVYSEAKKFEIYAAAPDLWNIDIYSYEIDRAYEREDEQSAERGIYAPRRWYADGYLARYITAYDASDLLKPYLSPHNFASLQAYLKTDPYMMADTKFRTATGDRSAV